jgi:hypothetical protein
VGGKPTQKLSSENVSRGFRPEIAVVESALRHAETRIEHADRIKTVFY